MQATKKNGRKEMVMKTQQLTQHNKKETILRYINNEAEQSELL